MGTVPFGVPNWSGNIFDFFFRINQSITAGVKVPFKIASDNATWDDDTPVHKALREVLANALIHADYHGRRGIVIDKYPKRLEVSNPGTLRMSKSVAIAGGTSDARNGKYSTSSRSCALANVPAWGFQACMVSGKRRNSPNRP